MPSFFVTTEFLLDKKWQTKPENRSFYNSQNKINESFRRAISWGNIRPMMRRKSISLDNIRSFFTILAREVDCVALFITKAILRGEIFSLRNFTILLRYPVDLLSRIGYFSSLIAPKNWP